MKNIIWLVLGFAFMGTLATAANSYLRGDALRLRPAALPSSAADGEIRIDSTDGNVKKYSESGAAWSTIAGGGGGGVVSFIEDDNSNAESTIGDWVGYDDGATPPVDAAGGTPTVFTVTRTTTSTEILKGLGSFKFSKSAATCVGEGASVPFTIDRAFRGRTLNLTFELDSTQSVNFANGNIKLYVLDVDSPEMVSVVGGVLKNNDLPAMKDTYVGRFPTKTTAENYKLVVHCDDSSSNTWNVFADEIKASPQQIIYSTPSGQYLGQLTTTGSWTTNTTYNFKYWRDGEFLIAHGLVSLSGGGPNSASLTINLPNNYTIDTSKLVTGAIINLDVGNGTIEDSGFGYYGGVNVKYNGPTSVGLYTLFNNVYSGTTYLRDVAAITELVPVPFASGDKISIKFQVPVVQFASDAVLSTSQKIRLAENFSMTRVVGTQPTKIGEYRSYRRNASTRTYTESAGEPTATPSVVNGFKIYGGNGWGITDTNSEPTRYEIFAGINKNVTFEFYAQTGRTGELDKSFHVLPGGTQTAGVNAGYNPTTGIASVFIFSYSSVTSTQFTGVANNSENLDSYFDVIISDNPLSVEQAQPCTVRYKRSANFYPTVSNVTKRIDFDVLDFSTGNCFGSVQTGANWTFTANVGGIYQVSGLITQAYSAASAVSSQLTFIMNKNGTPYANLGQRIFDVTNNAFGSASGATLVSLNAGDTLSFDVFQNTGTAQNLSNSGNLNHISIALVAPQ